MARSAHEHEVLGAPIRLFAVHARPCSVARLLGGRWSSAPGWVARRLALVGAAVAAWWLVASALWRDIGDWRGGVAERTAALES